MTCLAAPTTFFSKPSAGPPPDTDRWRRVELAVALTMAVPLGKMRAATRSQVDAAFARQIAMYIAHAVLGMGYRAIGRLCGRDRKTVAYACRVVEQRRDDPAIDRMLHVLTDFCRDVTECRT
ncbi:hypothetical protein MXD81_08670 [Microbacteriaceae bacterium K1510]|nr:hypothetical protein [Microbacteriaceae bacterium K1510]